MVASELINYTIPTLKPTDSVNRALELMEFYSLQKLVIAENETYRGMVSQSYLDIQSNKNTFLMDLLPELEDTFVKPGQHILEVLALSNKYGSQLLAVVDDDFFYKGSITRVELLSAFGNQYGVDQLGAIIVLAINDIDYSLAEIARLIESNNTKVLSSFIYKSDETDFKNTLTIKLNSQNVNKIIATLERFGYEIVAVYSNEKVESIEKERYDMLMKYLEI
jgi:acetoin utilization protein AcuB